MEPRGGLMFTFYKPETLFKENNTSVLEVVIIY